MGEGESRLENLKSLLKMEQLTSKKVEVYLGSILELIEAVQNVVS